MLKYLETLPWTLSTTIVATVFISLAIAAILLIRKFTNHTSLRGHHDVAAVVFANLGVLYSVLLGFTVVNVQQRFDQTETITHLEATLLAQLYLDSEVFPPEAVASIKQAITEYAKSVINEEWKLMEQGIKSEKTTEKLKTLWSVFYALEPESKKQEIWYAQSVAQLNKLMEARLSRLIGSQESLSSEMWSLLIFGAVVLVGFICIFGLANIWIHLLLGASLAATTGVLLLLIYSLDTAFSGVSSIEPTAMQKVLEDFN